MRINRCLFRVYTDINVVDADKYIQYLQADQRFVCYLYTHRCRRWKFFRCDWQWAKARAMHGKHACMLSASSVEYDKIRYPNI